MFTAFSVCSFITHLVVGNTDDTDNHSVWAARGGKTDGRKCIHTSAGHAWKA